MMPSGKKKAMADTENYSFMEVSLDKVRNRHELRVIGSMREQIDKQQDFCGCPICIEDVYAAAMNAIPPHYVQAGSMILNKNVPSELDIQRAVSDAYDMVRIRPNHPE